eukprot:TRINITY_DN3163_c0_g1_i1.p1 TRINITY_DN3163_c0_g1~~TRINITY_DN3163_c0_g1_i1.p1  ORF type:complete len:246 (+),score=22.69 TRINITY_DN3163_c0_g1_i1:184-921(+)
MNHLLSLFGNGNGKEQKTIEKPILNISGGNSSKDGMVFGFSLLKGKRPNMEDFHYAKFLTDERVVGIIGAFGIFDGHGGACAADYAKDNLMKNMVQHPLFSSDTDTAIGEAYVETDDKYLAMTRPVREDQESFTTIPEAGSTAVTAIVKEGWLHVANVGDSKCVLCREGKAIQMSHDHKADDPNERQRIENAGGIVIWAGTWRVGGVLAVTRAIGDRPLKKICYFRAVYKIVINSTDRRIYYSSQ